MPTFPAKFIRQSLAWAARIDRAAGKPPRRRAEANVVKRAIAWAAEMRKRPGVFIPLYIKNPLNTRRHWRAVSADAKDARIRVDANMIVARVPKVLPARVTMTRFGCRKLDEGCGLNASLKPVRDGVADYFGVDDADPRYEWVYRQELSPRGCNGVSILIEAIGGSK